MHQCTKICNWLRFAASKEASRAFSRAPALILNSEYFNSPRNDFPTDLTFPNFQKINCEFLAGCQYARRCARYRRYEYLLTK